MADVLENACAVDPFRCPSVLELITSAPSKLPAWMLQSPMITVQQATREVKPGTTSVGNSVIANISNNVRPSSQAPQAPAATRSTTWVPSSSPQPSAQIPAAISGRDVARHAITYAFIGVFFVWLWFPLMRLLLGGLRASAQVATWGPALAYLLGCCVLGYRRAGKGVARVILPRQAVQSSTVPTPPAHVATIPAAPITRPAPSPTSTVGSSVSSRAAVAQMALVGSRIRLVYHKPSCKWVMKISYRNRIQFGSVAAAKAAGYRACGVCSP
jgi:hypothetical protein